MIVQVTPALPGRSNVAAVKDAGGGGGRKPVCICNTHIEALKPDPYKAKKHGSLDHLLPPAPPPPNTSAPPGIDNGNMFAMTKTAPPPPEHQQNYRLEKFYHQINGDLFEITRKVPIQPAAAGAAATGDPLAPNQHPPLHAKRSLTKQQSQPQLRRSEHNDLVNRPDKPQAPQRVSSRQKNLETDFNGEFDRTQLQRLSSRSAGGVEGTNSSEWPTDRQHHQRHSSGPSELTLLQSDISDWLLNKRGGGLAKVDSGKSRDLSKTEVVLSKSLKEELAQLLKRPITRQHSGGTNDLAALKDDIVEWLKSSTKLNAAATGTSSSGSKEKATKTDSHIVPLPKKRHSFGHAEATNSDVPDWIPYPINRLSAFEREKLGVTQGSCIDISTKNRTERSSSRSEHRRHEHKLRHSASEVVTPITDSNRQSRRHSSSRRDKYQQPQPSSSYIYSSIGGERPERSGKRDRSRKSHTQRSNTVTDMSANMPIYAQPRKSSSAERESRKNASHAKCTDPMCPLIPICTDPNCCLNECYNTKRCSSLPRCREPHCTIDCYTDGPSLPQCIDPKCICRSSNANIIKHNSLPRCVSSHRSGMSSSLSRGGSRSSLPRITKTNGRLVKSASAASLNSRRRRHKTVHFGENLLREVCQNRKLIEPLQKTPSEKPSLESNIQMLYNFVEGVLSAWVDEDDDNVRSGAESEPERGRMLKPLYRCNRLRMQTIRRVVGEAAQLRGTLKLGNSRYRHRHWRGTAMECNERFLRKVNTNSMDG